MRLRGWIIGLGGALLAGPWAPLRGSDPAGPQPANPAPAAVSAPTAAAEPDAPTPAELADAYRDAPSTDEVEAAYRAAPDPAHRAAALGDLLNPLYRRSDAVRILQRALADPAPSVRIAAARLLFTLGSAAGQPVLRDVIRSAAAAPDARGLSDAVDATVVLQRFGVPVDPALLLQLYQRKPDVRLLEPMAIAGDPRCLPVLLAAAKADPIEGNVRNLGVLGAPGAAPFVRQLFATTKNPITKVAAAWAVYRTTGDRAALGYVIDRAGWGATPVHLHGVVDSDVLMTAQGALDVTADPALVPLLRRQVTARDAELATSSLMSLAYVQHDAAFVDGVLRAYLAAASSYPGLDGNAVWRLAAAWPGDARLRALARAANAGAYERYFVREHGRLVAGWLRGSLGPLPRRPAPR